MVSTQTASAKARAGILIVEDEGLIASHISSRLLKTGFHVVGIAESSEEAIARIPELNPELVLMDIHIKGDKDGIDTAAILRDRFDLPVIYLTAHTDRQTIDRAKMTGAFGFLSKPIHHASLANAIEMAIHKHRADRAVRDQRAWMATALATMADAVLVIDSERRAQFLNPPAEKLTGWTSAEAANLDIAQILPLMDPVSGLPPAAVNEPLSAWADRDGISFIPRGALLTKRSGEKFPIEGEIAASVVAGTGAGRVAGAVITFRDASARIAQENEIRHQHKMQAVGRLAAGVAHDFNNLLFIILGYTDEMLRSCERTEADVQALNEIRKAAENAANITQQLLRFSRKEPMEKQDVDLNALIGETEEMFRRIGGPSIRWQFRMDRRLRTVHADPGQLKQVLMNLATNARDAMPGGGRITVETVNVDLPRADLPGPGRDSYIALIVTDTGSGMSAETAERLFEPFFTTKEPGHGTGLGLSIVHTIVTGLGGSIDVDTDPGAGTTFTVYLPAGASEAAAPSPVQPSSDSGSDSITILLVEDQENVRNLLRRYLAGAGCNVLEAVDGADAIRVANEYTGSIDVLITDVMMPRADGAEIANALAAQRRNLRILLISGLPHELTGALGNLPAGSRFLPKPFLRTDLLKTVTDLVAEEKSLSTRSFFWS